MIRLVAGDDSCNVSLTIFRWVAASTSFPPPDDVSFLRVAHKIYVQHSKFPKAHGLSIRLGDPDLIREDFNAPGNPCVYLSLRLTLSLI
jgi:26S proteasome regulatory subunit N1